MPSVRRTVCGVELRLVQRRKDGERKESGDSEGEERRENNQDRSRGQECSVGPALDRYGGTRSGLGGAEFDQR